MPCKNKGCNGHCRKGQFFCYDCYTAWLNGGDEAVQARLAELGADKAELARLVEFANKVRHAVLGPPEFNGKAVGRDYSDKALFDAIHAGREVVLTADKVARAMGADLPTRLGLVARRRAVVEWLKGLGRVTATEVSQHASLQELRIALSAANAEVEAKELTIRSLRGKVCPCRNTAFCQQPQAVRLEAPDSKANQLNRIESLAKQAAIRSSAPAFWLGVSLSGTILGLCHFLWS